MEQHMEQRQNNTQDLGMKLIIERLSLLHEDVSDLRDDTKASMKEMANAVTKLVLIEERQTQMNEAYRNFTNQLEKSEIRTNTLEARIDLLEKEQPMTKQVVNWVIYAVGAIVVASCTYLLKALGFM